MLVSAIHQQESAAVYKFCTLDQKDIKQGSQRRLILHVWAEYAARSQNRSWYNSMLWILSFLDSGSLFILLFLWLLLLSQLSYMTLPPSSKIHLTQQNSGSDCWYVISQRCLIISCSHTFVFLPDSVSEITCLLKIYLLSSRPNSIHSRSYIYSDHSCWKRPCFLLNHYLIALSVPQLAGCRHFCVLGMKMDWTE